MMVMRDAECAGRDSDEGSGCDDCGLNVVRVERMGEREGEVGRTAGRQGNGCGGCVNRLRCEQDLCRDARGVSGDSRVIWGSGRR